ncbi:hypothetical protein U27_00416 [Candidatus Vecturithrix granuli]|uniref:Uncharacterized protein n=1 Tax=Vecturithrix granuli TaxID=1499967 RepID=A0A081C7G4_VECG1|nr:hypothetical protein U27_00416 [Candidatus Vecturithrix granuli]
MPAQKPLYKLVFDGKIREGEDLRQVKARLSALFRTDEKTIDRLFQNPSTVVKHGLTQQEVARYQQAIEKTGMICRILKERPQAQVNAKKTKICPRCGLEQEAERSDCMRCGIVFARFHSQSERQRKGDEERSVGQTHEDDMDQEKQEEEEYTGPLSVEREGWWSLTGGAVITAIVMLIPFLNYIFSYLIVLVHELGHTVCHWVFGYPSIPAFDFVYGGGVAIHQDRQMILLAVIYLCFVYLFYLFRRNLPTMVILAVVAVSYSLAVFTPIHEVISLFMGHGFELIFAAIFLYRAISGSAVIIAVERPLYGFLGMFIEFRAIGFAYRLMTSQDYRADYEAAKGGGHWMDFSRIAEEYLRVDLSVVAGLFLICCLMPPVVAFLAYRYQTSWMFTLSKLLSPEPE